MEITLAKVITWLILGGLAGSFVGAVTQRKKEGFGALRNMGIGLVGAVLGGLIFSLFNIDLGLSAINVTAEDLVAAIGGSFLLLFLVWIWRKTRAKKPAA